METDSSVRLCRSFNTEMWESLCCASQWSQSTGIKKLAAPNKITQFNCILNRYIMIAHHSVYGRIYKRNWIILMLVFCWVLSYGFQLPTLFKVWGRARQNEFHAHRLMYFFNILREIRLRSKPGDLLDTSWWQREKQQDGSLHNCLRNTLRNYYCLLRKNILGRSRVSLSRYHWYHWAAKQTKYLFLARSEQRMRQHSTAQNAIPNNQRQMPASGCSNNETTEIGSESRLQSVKTKKLTDQRDAKQKRNEWRITKMVLAIFLSFIACYLPITITKVLDKDVNWPGLHIFGYIMLYLSACINPIIYVIMNRQYRQAYKSVLLCKATRLLSFTNAGSTHGGETDGN